GITPSVVDTPTSELVRAAAGHEASLYACGITPYDATHLGHAATYLAWDLLVRAWRDAGHRVTYVQNVTDVDDPLLERAARRGGRGRGPRGRRGEGAFPGRRGGAAVPPADPPGRGRGGAAGDRGPRPPARQPGRAVRPGLGSVLLAGDGPGVRRGVAARPGD